MYGEKYNYTMKLIMKYNRVADLGITVTSTVPQPRGTI